MGKHSEDTSVNFSEKIKNNYSQLAPSARQVADYMQQNPLAAVTLSVKQIAEKVGTSKASVSRFFQQLGFNSHQDVKAFVLKQREQGVPIANPSSLAATLEQELENVSTTLAAINTQDIADIAQRIINAKKVFVIGARTSYPLALSLRQQLTQIRNDVELLPKSGQTLAEDLIDIGSNDYVIVFGLRRRPKIFEKLINALPNKNTLLITEPGGQIYRQHVQDVIVCQLGQAQAFDSYAAPMAVVSLLCNQAYQLSGDTGSARSQQISTLYKELDELS
ncbi:MurR/RpiR family transcriptional regulator [Alteromonas sp. 5E99-2]|uniref:MurR/RpiR family transcriptional regulator n=1 Tax=Alteromonas sp. 5E99-2 TaxID=2817683 RepID=UPI001A995D94|nr:MurR/RpiR family transcriptional regulator [Alteromonas sp. 5E99-2]MBO1255705.1 MurR/RpiR family transcriptional regulator [Alteromonas sp. 5E99-2]